MLARLAPILFPIIWSTGWIVARYTVDFADPLAFLCVRYAGAGVALGAFAFASGARWPRSGMDWIHACVSGVLLHAVYLGGVWWAIEHGVPASVSALIAASQPIMTAFLAPALVGERIGLARWAGVFLGFVGICLVLAPKLIGLDAAQLKAALLPIGVNFVAMIGVTAGTFYQKRYIHSGDLRTVAALQYVGALAAGLPAAYAFGDFHIDWTPTAWAVLAWSVLALSIGAIALLLYLIRRGEVSRSAQLIFLVPPLSALQAHFLFGENLGPVQIAGMALTVCGVAMAARTKA
ncbi:MAG: DMT family transporter [Hyphomicrobiales bacterium]|nr:DMT family transporter [Hyphomicrobiales bacterium]